MSLQEILQMLQATAQGGIPSNGEWTGVPRGASSPMMLRALGAPQPPTMWEHNFRPSQNIEDHRQLVHLPAAPPDSVDRLWADWNHRAPENDDGSYVDPRYAEMK